MLKMKSKKGFTLAELLIVVAIIAVLTAIAVPLFVGALNNSKEAVKNANIRAVRSAAVAAILLNDGLDMTNNNDGSSDKAKQWEVKATVDSTGNVTIDSITPVTSSSTMTKEGKCDPDTGDKKKYKVEVLIEADDLTKINTKGE